MRILVSTNNATQQSFGVSVLTPKLSASTECVFVLNVTLFTVLFLLVCVIPDSTSLVAVEEQRCQLELLVSGVLLPRKPGDATRNQSALVLLLGPPSTGKSLVVEAVLHGFRTGKRAPTAAVSSSQGGDAFSSGVGSNSTSHPHPQRCSFKTVYLDGLLLRTDEEAILEFCEQLSSGTVIVSFSFACLVLLLLLHPLCR